MDETKEKGFFGRIGEKLGLGRAESVRNSFSTFFDAFQKILDLNNQVLDLMAGMGDILSGDYVFDRRFIESTWREISDLVDRLIGNLNTMAPRKYMGLYDAFRRINGQIDQELAGRPVIPQSDHVVPLSLLGRDLEDVVGAKTANLAEIGNILGLAVPRGFAVTTRASDAFMEENALRDREHKALAAWEAGEITLDRASRELGAMILAGRIPDGVRKAMKKALASLEKEADRGLYLAVRSSAWGEDGESSFAGQYLSMLNVPASEFLDAYRRVLASLFSPSAMKYRRDRGFPAEGVAMAVGALAMVNARVSGVLYTLDPLNPDSGELLVTAVWGLGAPLVDGSISGDRFAVSRRPPHKARTLSVGAKEEMRVLLPKGGTAFSPVPAELRNEPCLTPEQLAALAEAGLAVERHFKKPQDMEWALDREGRLVILQARPLALETHRDLNIRNLPEILSRYSVILADKGVIVQRGIGVGRAFIVRGDESLEHFPPGAVLVARQTSPRFAKVIRRASAILTDVGSPTGHMATIAREFRVPAIVDMGDATRLIAQGQEITVDAEGNRVYDGIVKELQDYHLREENIEDAYEYRLLRRILKKIAPLNLLDPHARNFSPDGCRTLHDITRFIHEKAVEELISLQFSQRHDPGTFTGKLKLAVPLDLVLIDIGGGLAPGTGTPIEPDRVESLPMKAFLKGLTRPGAWNTDPMNVDFSSFMSSLTRTFSADMASPEILGQNLAVISAHYANISLRLGYHFSMTDSYIHENPNNNYAYFRFQGGVTETHRRSRRAKVLADVLAANDFVVEVKGDLVVARIKKVSREVMEEKLYLLGVLEAFARQLDVQMDSDQHVAMYVEHFNKILHSEQNPDGQGGLHDGR